MVQWKNITDVYSQPFGIRTVQITDKNLLINGKPVYLMGFGKHEDSNVSKNKPIHNLIYIYRDLHSNSQNNIVHFMKMTVA